MRFVFAAAAFAALFAAAPARAEVASATPNGFLIQAEAEVATTPERAWRALGQVGRWWNNEHTYSGDGGRMQVDLRAGGCWCERWGSGQSVEHGRVVLMMEHEGVRTLRFSAALGPLQEMAVNGALTFTVAPHANGAKITMTYRVSGDPGLNLEQTAPLVDMVLMEQFGRLSRYSASGSPE
ncbi:MAG TPA: hypothetical protein VFO00_04525 [Vitreimonas sp.]|nr:hypothetical protein [Vitreimonas sp.]